MQESLQTPFTTASEREQRWARYSAWLERQVDEPLFAEAFSLKQIYIPLRACYERKPETQPSKDVSLMTGKGETNKLERVLVELEPTLLNWVKTAEKEDAVRVICGGPGCGKFSFAKIFAARLIANKTIPVLFVPWLCRKNERMIQLNSYPFDVIYRPF